MPAPPFLRLPLLPPIAVTFPPVIVMEAVSPRVPTPGQSSPPVAVIVPPSIRMSPQTALNDAPMAQASFPPVAVMMPLVIVIPAHVAKIVPPAPMPAASKPWASTVPVVETVMFAQAESYPAPMPAEFAPEWAVEVAVTLALPEIVIFPHGLRSLAAPMPAAHAPPVA